jgi:RNA polymerase sigma factor (sigma-70 family)
VSWAKPKSNGRDLWAASDTQLRDCAAYSNPTQQVAWTVLTSRLGPAIKRAIVGVLVRKGLLLDSNTVDDLIESTWLRMVQLRCQKLKEWDPKRGASLSSHAVTVAMGIALTWCKYHIRRREVVMDHNKLQRSADKADSRLSPEQSAWLNEAETMINEWEQNLKFDQRRLLHLWREGMSQSDIARRLGRCQQFVSWSLLDLRRKVARLLTGLRR